MGAKSGGALPNLRSFGPKTASFRPKLPPNPGKTAKRRETVATLHVRPDFTQSQSALQLHNLSEKQPKKAPRSPKICAMCTNTPKPSTGPIVDPRTRGNLVEQEGSTARAQLGPTVGPPWSLGRKKMIFFKVVPRPLAMLKQVFLGRFEPSVARYGPWKIPTCLENGPFWDQKWVKNGSKTHFSQSDPRPFGMLKQVFLAHFKPI